MPDSKTSGLPPIATTSDADQVALLSNGNDYRVRLDALRNTEENRILRCAVVEPFTPGNPGNNYPANNAWTTIANLTGPGNVETIQLALVCNNNAGLGDGRIRFTIDGGAPMECDIGTFFLNHGSTPVFQSENLTSTHYLDNDNIGVFRRIFVPYQTSCVIDIQNRSASSGLIFTQVYYRQGVIPAFVTGTRRKKFHMVWTPFNFAAQIAPYASIDVLNDTNVRGQMEGIHVFGIMVGSTGTGWLEGNPSFTIDGGVDTFHTGGTEDFFGTQFYGDQIRLLLPDWGNPTNKLHPNGLDSFWAAYRYFNRQPVIFNQSVKFTMVNGAPGQGPVAPTNLALSACVTWYTES